MTVACQVGGDPRQKPVCPSGKIGFATAEECHWYINRGRSSPKAKVIYRCHCEQFHWTSRPITEYKRVIRDSHRRLGTSGLPVRRAT